MLKEVSCLPVSQLRFRRAARPAVVTLQGCGPAPLQAPFSSTGLPQLSPRLSLCYCGEKWLPLQMTDLLFYVVLLP